MKLLILGVCIVLVGFFVGVLLSNYTRETSKEMLWCEGTPIQKTLVEGPGLGHHRDFVLFDEYGKFKGIEIR